MTTTETRTLQAAFEQLDSLRKEVESLRGQVPSVQFNELKSSFNELKKDFKASVGSQKNLDDFLDSVNEFKDLKQMIADAQESVLKLGQELSEVKGDVAKLAKAHNNSALQVIDLAEIVKGKEKDGDNPAVPGLVDHVDEIRETLHGTTTVPGIVKKVADLQAREVSTPFNGYSPKWIGLVLAVAAVVGWILFWLLGRTIWGPGFANLFAWMGVGAGVLITTVVLYIVPARGDAAPNKENK